jgi:fumarate hydratase subunit beta
MKSLRNRKNAIKVRTPVDEETIRQLKIGDRLEIWGNIYCGRDAVLPRITRLLEKKGLDTINVHLKGAVIFHTAVSIAGIGPTSSNKVEIEESIPLLSRAGVRIHLGKGALNSKSIKALKQNNAIFAVTPPTSALFAAKTLSQRLVAFKEEGMEALYEISVIGFPAIVAIAHGKTLFAQRPS